MTDVQESPEASAPPLQGGNAVGVASYVTACAGLGPVALVLGALGLRRWRAGEASRRDLPIAGLVVGAVGTVVAAGLGVVVATGGAGAATTDARAQADVIGVGNAVVGFLAANPNSDAVDISLTEAGYAVEGEPVRRSLPAGLATDLAFSWKSPFEWCLTLTYTGGSIESAAYSANDGLIASCS